MPTTPVAKEQESPRSARRKSGQRRNRIGARGAIVRIASGTDAATITAVTLSRWDELTRFIDDGRVEIDSNTVERSIRPIALNRKNASFAGSDAGAEHWGTIASLIETAKLNGVEPMAYLTDVITKIVNGHPSSQIDELLPWSYRPGKIVGSLPTGMS